LTLMLIALFIATSLIDFVYQKSKGIRRSARLRSYRDRSQ
jgi:hypothetical protein